MRFWQKLFGQKQANAKGCDKCGRPVKKRTRPRPDWEVADEVDWYCPACQVTFCGKCSTAKLQELKQKYQATGESLKISIKYDSQALYFASDLEPHCPHCNMQTLEVAAGQERQKKQPNEKATQKRPDRTRSKVLNDEGIAAAQRGDNDLAMQKLNAAIEADPSWGVPWNNLGVVYRDMGANSEAMRCLAKAMALKAFD